MSADKTIRETGERELIELLSPYVQCGRGGHWSVGVGDDAAVSSSKATGKKQVVTTDLLIEETHFLWNADTPWFWLGRKAATANLSDIAAMGAWPTGMVVSVGLPPEMRVGDLLELYRGIHYLSLQEFGAPIIGGDTTRSGALMISITCFGEKTFSQAECLRSDARPGDYVYVTDTLGASRMGLEFILDPGLTAQIPPEMAEWPFLNQPPANYHYMMSPRCEMGVAISRALSRVGMLDVSDGLYNELHLMAEASGVGLDIDLNSVPVHLAAEAFCDWRGIDAHEYALFSGEEYELLFACEASPDELEEAVFRFAVPEPIYCLGRVTESREVRFLRDGVEFVPSNATFRHF